MTTVAILAIGTCDDGWFRGPSPSRSTGDYAKGIVNEEQSRLALHCVFFKFLVSLLICLCTYTRGLPPSLWKMYLLKL
jgi:hypothetical protein